MTSNGADAVNGQVASAVPVDSVVPADLKDLADLKIYSATYSEALAVSEVQEEEDRRRVPI